MKIKNWVFFTVILLIGIAQSALLDYLSILGAKPDLLLLAVIFFSLYCGHEHGLKAALAAGLYKDITSAAVFGSHTFGFCVCALFLSRYGSHFYKQKILTQVVLCACLYCVAAALILFLNSAVLKNADVQLGVYFLMITKAAVYTGCVSPIVFFILSKIFEVRIRYA